MIQQQKHLTSNPNRNLSFGYVTIQLRHRHSQRRGDERKTIKCFNNAKQQSLFREVSEGVNGVEQAAQSPPTRHSIIDTDL